MLICHMQMLSPGSQEHTFSGVMKSAGCSCAKAKGKEAAEAVARQALEKEALHACTGYMALSILSALGRSASAGEVKNALVPLAKHKSGKACACYAMCRLLTECQCIRLTLPWGQHGLCRKVNSTIGGLWYKTQGSHYCACGDRDASRQQAKGCRA